MAINLVDLTNDNGNGVFDKLMASMRGILQEEFTNNRITGTEYSKIFLSVTDSVLNQSMQFLLQKDQAAKQVEVLEAQRLLTVAQQAAVVQETLLTAANISKTEREIILLDTQEQVMEAQVLLTQSQVTKVDAEVEILTVEKTKTAAEVNLVNASVDETNKKVEVLDAQLDNIPKEGLLLDKQVLKTNAETVFLDQRLKTEKSQIVDLVDGTAVTGVIGKQKELYVAQTKGFATKAEQDLLSLMTNTWVVRRTTDEGTQANHINKLYDPNIGLMLEKCMSSVGVNALDTPAT